MPRNPDEVYGAFFQLTLTAKGDFPVEREQLKVIVFGILPGTCV